MINNLDIKCIGYKKAFNGSKMYHYKLTVMNKEYLLVNASLFGGDDGMLLDMIWGEDNKFHNSDLSEQMITLIKETIPIVPKVDDELTDEDEANFYKKYEIIEEEEEEEEYIKPIGVFTSHEVNELLSVFNEFDITYDDGDEKEITQEMVDYALEENGYDLLSELLGYKVSFQTDGSHKNDGQMVEYDFWLTSPEGVETHFSTEMCLMIGWNYHKELKIN